MSGKHNLINKWNGMFSKNNRLSTVDYNYALWTLNKKVNFQTKTENLQVLELYDYILNNEFTDSDYWFSGGNESLQYMLKRFSKTDWDNLKADLVNWTSNQLNILADAVIFPSSANVEEDTNALYGYIFTLVEDEEADYLIQNISVLNDDKRKDIELLLKVKVQINKLETYTRTVHSVHNYVEYYSLIDTLIDNASSQHGIGG